MNADLCFMCPSYHGKIEANNYSVSKFRMLLAASCNTILRASHTLRQTCHRTHALNNGPSRCTVKVLKRLPSPDSNLSRPHVPSKSRVGNKVDVRLPRSTTNVAIDIVLAPNVPNKLTEHKHRGTQLLKAAVHATIAAEPLSPVNELQ